MRYGQDNPGYEPPSIYYPILFVVAVSGMFAVVPLAISVPLAFGPWLVITVIGYIATQLRNRRAEQDTLTDRMKRWYGDEWEQARNNVIYRNRRQIGALNDRAGNPNPDTRRLHRAVSRPESGR
jgi:hypothetical protein